MSEEYKQLAKGEIHMFLKHKKGAQFHSKRNTHESYMEIRF
jgi:hypothetical protein